MLSEVIQARLQGMKRRLDKQGMQIDSLRFNGVLLSEFSREELLVILADLARKRNDHLGEDVIFYNNGRG